MTNTPHKASAHTVEMKFLTRNIRKRNTKKSSRRFQPAKGLLTSYKILYLANQLCRPVRKRKTRLKNEKDKKSEASLTGAYIGVRDRNETELAAVFRRFSVEFFPTKQMNMQVMHLLPAVFTLVDDNAIAAL